MSSAPSDLHADVRAKRRLLPAKRAVPFANRWRATSWLNWSKGSLVPTLPKASVVGCRRLDGAAAYSLSSCSGNPGHAAAATTEATIVRQYYGRCRYSLLATRMDTAYFPPVICDCRRQTSVNPGTSARPALVCREGDTCKPEPQRTAREI